MISNILNNNINVITWNARGIRKKYFEFLNFLNSNKVDIALITETWLTSEVRLPSSDYKCYRVDRTDLKGGGVAILIRKSIQHSLLPTIKTQSVENIGISVRLMNSKEIKVYCVYFPGGSSSDSKRKVLKRDFNQLFAINGEYLLGGDFNCRHKDWGCIRANAWGNLLANLSLVLPINILFPPSPTYFPASSRGSPSVLDLFITNVPSLISQPITVSALSSDHNPVFCRLPWSGEKKVQYIQQINKANWKFFQTSLNMNLQNISTDLENISCINDVDCIVHDFTQAILSSVDKSVPKTIKKDDHTNTKLPVHVLDLIKMRNIHRRSWQKYRQPFYQNMVSHFNQLISNEILKFRNEKWNKKLSVLDKNGKPFWNIVKIIKNKNRNIPFLKDSGQTICTNVDKANLFARQFSTNHLVSQNLGDRETEILVEESIEKFDASQELTPSYAFVGVEDIKSVIKRLKVKKTGGLDQIKNVYLKHLPITGVKYLTFIINACLKLQYFPATWKIAKIVPISKAGKASDNAGGYRPISLLSSISKVYEKVLKEKILKVVYNKKIFPDQQFGFRTFHSTSHQVKRICNHVKRNRAQSKSTGMVLLDIEKAFDSVWHKGIIYKMLTFKIPLYLCKIVQSFLSGRCFSVFVDGGVSSLVNFNFGVPQGSVLGPSLYNLYTSDFPKIPQCESAIFADDVAIFCSDKLALNIERSLSRAVEILHNYYNKWKIKLNDEKFQAIFFTRKRKSCYLPSSQLKINGKDIAWERSVKYLGIHLDTKLTFSDHINSTLKKIGIAIKLLYPFINRNSTLTNDNKIIIFKVIFQAILLYGSPVWGKAASCHIKKLQVSQNKLLKMMLNLPWRHSTIDLHQRANVEWISERIQKLANKFDYSCDISENPLINQL